MKTTQMKTTKIEKGKICSKEFNNFLSQIGKNDNVNIRLSDNQIMLFAYNQRMDFRIVKNHTLSDNGIDFALHKETLQRFTKISDSLSFEFSDDKLKINDSLVTLDDDLKAYIPEIFIADGQKHELDVKLMEKLMTHCNQEENRFTYNGVCLEVLDNILSNIPDYQIASMIATDGRRMAVNKLSVVENMEVDQIVIHYGALKAAISIAKKKKISTIIWNSVSNDMTIDDIVIRSNPLGGKFPDWEKIIPVETNFNVSARKDDLLAVLKQCKETTEKPSHQVKISVIDYSTLKFSTEIVDVMKKDYELKAEHNLENDFEVAFNAVYLLDAIKMLEHETVNLKFVDSNRPLLIEEENKTILIMPMRI